MIILPAIDLIGGKCVRLKQGRYDDVTIYNDSPLDQAFMFKEAGATWIHVVDLDAYQKKDDPFEGRLPS